MVKRRRVGIESKGIEELYKLQEAYEKALNDKYNLSNDMEKLKSSLTEELHRLQEAYEKALNDKYNLSNDMEKLKSSLTKELHRLQEAYEKALNDKDKLSKEIEKIKKNSKNEQKSLKEELSRLQDVCEKMLNDKNKLDNEIGILKKGIKSEREIYSETKKELSQANRDLSLQKLQIQRISRQKEVIQVRYDALSHSKLGRLTLYFWARQAEKNKKGIHKFAIIEKIFAKLPTTEELYSKLGIGETVNIQESNSNLEIAVSKQENQIESEIAVSKQENQIESEISVSKQESQIESEIAVSKQESQIESEIATSKQESQTNSEIVINKNQSELPQNNNSDVMSFEQKNWINKYIDIINSIADSNGCRYYQKIDCKIGIICDEFYYDFIKEAANFIYITPNNWKTVIDNGIDVFLFVSTWRGLDNVWKGLGSITRTDKNKETAFELLEYCKNNSIVTIFYSKEDPPNYEVFLEYAKKCDYIFTSAKECVPYYKDDCNNKNVAAVTFGINPQLNNPIGIYNSNKEKTILFSGSWMKKYPIRCEDLSVIFDGIMSSSYGLHIIDRNFPMNKGYRFPDKYFKYTSPALNHELLQKIHKLFNWAVNINSVKNSETMFANRAFELQASGVLLLSNFSVGINNILPNVMMINDSSEVSETVNKLNYEQIYERQIAGIRSVMTKHTCYDRISELLSFCEIKTNQPERTIIVIADNITDNVKECFENQTYNNKFLISKENFNKEIFDEYDMIAWFDKNAYYGQFYLEDLANGFKYTNCDYITKDAYYNGEILEKGIEHNYVNKMKNKYRTLFWRNSYTYDFIINLDGELNLENGYSIDHFSYNLIVCKKEKQNKNYLLSVIIPIFNNGEHLYGKCFNSLTKSSMFDDMEVIFVDDGSTDDRTLKIEDYIKSQYSNVIVYRFNDGGSGSASRPRNKGVEIASSKYIVFIDPDDEAICDGYSKLYNIAENEDFDLVIGDIYKQRKNDISLSKYYNVIKRNTGKDCFYDGFENNIINVNFLAVNIQVMVIKKEVIVKNNLKQIVGAVGEDTLFSWQLLNVSKRIKITNLPVYVYYTQTAESVTNSINPKFFDKLFVLQEYKLKWLEESNLITDFMKLKYNDYTTKWILKALSVSEDSEQCVKIVEKILDIYSNYYNGESKLINDFMLQCKNNNYSLALDIINKAFPNNKIRPMLTLSDILSYNNSLFDTKFKRDESKFTFYNNTTSNTNEKYAYAWVILLDSDTYSKVYTTKYSYDNKFSFDFKNLEPQSYKVRCFVRKKDNTKLSEDIAYINVEKNGTVNCIRHRTKAVEIIR